MTTYTTPKPNGTPTWIDLMSNDIEGARKFYHALFGWEYDIGGPEFGGYTTARLGQRTVAGMSNPMPGAPAMPSQWGVFFASQDVQADSARAVELGAQIVSPAMTVGPFGSMAVCADPSGAVFSLWQAGQHIGFEVTDEPGAPTWYELYSSDAKQSRDYFTALLGATASSPGAPDYYLLSRGSQMLCGIMQIDPSWGGFQPQWGVYFQVADAKETAAIATMNGGRLFGQVVESPYGIVASLADPSGATFKVRQMPG